MSPFHTSYLGRAARGIVVASALLSTTALVQAAPPQSGSAAGSNWSWLSKLFSNKPAAAAATNSSVAGRDPTRANDELKKLLAAEDAKPTNANAVAAAPAYHVPRITLKALVLGEQGNPSAVLSVGDKQTMIVRAGREYPIAGDGAAQVNLIVHRIQADQVELEIQPPGQKLVLH